MTFAFQLPGPPQGPTLADAAWNGDTAVAPRGRQFLILMQDVADIPGYRIPVLHIGEPNEDGGIDFAPFEPLVRLFREEPLSSITSKRHIARAVRLFIEYVDHRWPRLAEIASSLRRTDVRRIFREFCVHIRTGTVDGTGPQTGTAALGWQPTSQGAARNLINGFGTFLNYVAEVTEPHRDMPGELGLPMGDDRLRNAYARAFGMMAHLKPSVPRKAVAMGRGIVGSDPHGAFRGSTKRFALPHLVNFLTEGSPEQVVTARSDVDPTGALQRLILGGGGIRESESRQMWVGDVTLVGGGQVKGFLRHPSFFVQDMGNGPRTREQILLERYGLAVRRSGMSRFAAGWKSPLMEDRYSAEIYWAPYPGFREYLASALYHYVTVVRREAMLKRKALGFGDHPYLLVCTSPTMVDGRMEVGQPYTAAAARSSWESAIRRLGRRIGEDLKVEKGAGTSIHSLRHLYGRTLHEAGFDEATIKRLMHHRSIRSSRVYTMAEPGEVHALLEAAEERLAAGGTGLVGPAFPTLGDVIDATFDPSGLYRR